MTTAARRGWWRQNRLWLAALPVVLVGAALVPLSHAKEYWYDNGYRHRAASGDRGEWVAASTGFEDALGATTRTFRVRLVDVEEVDDYPYADGLDEPGPPPEGLKVLQARLDWEADPDQVLFGCYAALVDDDGRRYETEVADSLDICTPEDRPGPKPPFLASDERGVAAEGEERPPAWSTTVSFLVPEGRDVESLWVYWEVPDYVELSVS